MSVRVQSEDFDPGAEIASLSAGRSEIGAVASFIGLVRGSAGGASAMTLEHYPGMTERQIGVIEEEARRRWPIDDAIVIHRFGRLLAGERIVLVAIAASHRAAAFAACEFIVDWLKTKAPFWKLEERPEGSVWVSAAESDQDRAVRWQIDTH
jgi:molybdopterin synthase catalytic subunit